MATKAKVKKISKKANKPAKKAAAKAAKKPVVRKAAQQSSAKPVKKPVAKKTVKKPVANKPVKLLAKAAVKPAKKPMAAGKSTARTAPKKPVVKAVTKSAAKANARPVLAPQAKATLVKSGAIKVLPKPAAQPLMAKVAQQKSAALTQAITAKKVEAKKNDAKKTVQDRSYRVGDHVVYPTHGVGRIMAEETQNIGEIELHMLVISFDKDKMTLRVPTHRAAAAGLRHVSSTDQMVKVFDTLKGKARASRGMWSRRAQEYEAKINSGNIFSVAEVVRDLHQNVDQSERSYSERMIYESALGRLVGELAASEAIDQQVATEKLLKLLRSRAA